MNYLKKEYRPQSNDPDYWNIWTTTSDDNERTADWTSIAKDWQEYKTETNDDE